MAEKTKLEILAEVKAKLDKKFGKGSVMGAHDVAMEIESISTGSMGLDLALGIGGLPKGRVVEIYGPESSGKTTLATHVIAEAMKADPTALCAFVDMEHAYDTGYAEKIGVDLERLQISQPDYGEMALEIADQLIETGIFSVVVIDSVAALVPKAELDGEMGENKMGLHSRLMSQALRKMTSNVSKTNTICIFINQLRDKIGVMFGSPETTTGGNALKFYASVRLDVRRYLSEGNVVLGAEGERIGNKTKVKVIKNKVAPPFKEAEFNVRYGVGIDKFEEAVEIAADLDVIQKSGSWYSYDGNKLGQGIASVKTILGDNPELFEEIRTKTINKIRNNTETLTEAAA
jgi:recombination protein RecA